MGEVLNMPDTFHDWEWGQGSVAKHKERWYKMRKENLVMILIHYFVNLCMLAPLFVTAENVYARHQENINAGLNIFDKEKEVVSMLTTLEWAMPLTIHLASILDILLAFVYRKYLHPWRRILEDPHEETEIVPKPLSRRWKFPSDFKIKSRDKTTG